MECCGVVMDYVLGMCLCIPCEDLYVSLSYFEVLRDAGIL